MLAAPLTTRSGLLDTPKVLTPQQRSKKHFHGQGSKKTLPPAPHFAPKIKVKKHQSEKCGRTINQANNLFLQDSSLREREKTMPRLI